MKRTEKGFSLIELSIVLIIIGLLVAGITGGASLVRSATVRAVMSEANSYNAAVNAYYARFSNLPGDDVNGKDKAGAALPGNGDGMISYADTSLGADSAAMETETDMEGMNAWQHMLHANIVEGDFVTTGITATLVPGDNTPKSKLSGAGWVFDNRNGTNTLVLMGSTGGAPIAGSTLWTFTSRAIIGAEAASSIDTKMDDGSANNGKILAYDGSDVTAEDCHSAGNYTNKTTPVCYMSFGLSL